MNTEHVLCLGMGTFIHVGFLLLGTVQQASHLRGPAASAACPAATAPAAAGSSADARVLLLVSLSISSP